MITLIGGEMPEYAEQRPPAGGPLYRRLIDRLPTGIRVLIAGPHSGALVRAVADRREVTLLLRSRPDAERVDVRDVRVLCGTLSKLADTDRYDAVIALDGTGRLHSPEGPPLDWVESVRVLKRALRPGGTLLLAVENELGVHRLVDPGTPTAARAGDAWSPLGEFGSAPGRPDRLAAALGAEGLPVAALAAVWPLPEHPALLATPETLRYGPLDALAALASAAAAPAYRERSVLSDPRRLAAAAVRRGLGAELAPAWLAVAQLATRPGQAVPLPPALIAGPGGAVTELVKSPDGTWSRRAVQGPGELTGPLPSGRLLEERLLTAALGHDLPGLRRLLTGWMTELPNVPAGNVLVDGDRYARLDPSAPDRADALARFAHTLATGGYHHPWPGVTDVARLTDVLAGAAGLTTAPTPAPTAGDELPDIRRRHEEQLDAVRRRLADAEDRVRFYEVELGKREAELGRAKVQIAAFSGSLGYRAAKAGLGIARAARNRIRNRGRK
ncbi:SAM-dependent methyltransferase [Actinoplanes campanulatus]|uniref:SAM-dependent methyltransferase n=1 Tax=Actinoplanes campanulatus TaxID=113559 RepID=A0A7W5FI18_9ACTN|nr:hypothetical protein [Actinoplanes campanulatus]MBB3099219.1 SAM-dependent methyltransferase [Actinoplanes campanulatus]GGN40943.1 hypothetical protein GCM10010109_70660 [Actinoplanes campanulatus]GID40537.1 hypothetical protein Aca09nite_70430 [Actinoplanes campanulatus]